MPTTTQHPDLLDYKVESVYRGKAVKICLSSSALDYNSSVLGVFSSELLAENGYNRIGALFSSGGGVYNPAFNEIALPEIEAIFTASSLPLQFQSAFVILGGKEVPGKYITAIDPTTDTITIANHGLMNGDRLIITPGAGGTIPSGLSNAQEYYVGQMTADNFELYDDPTLTQKIDFSDSGSGSIYARYATGIIAVIVTEDELITVPAGQSYKYGITIRETFTYF